MRSSERTRGPRFASCLLAWVLPAVIGYVAFLFVPQVLNDSDTYLHLAVGKWIMVHGTVPYIDPFSFSRAGAPWAAHEWLSELLMAIAFRWGGWSGLLVLFAVASALTAGLLSWHLARWLDPLALLIALLLAAACIAPSLLARPHILVLPILVVWTAELLSARAVGRVPWKILPLMVLWANMHGSFMLGLFLIFPFALEAASDSREQGYRDARDWALFSACAVFAALLTPYGWRELIYPFQLLGMKYLDAIGEWRPTSFATVQPIELALMTLLYVCLSRGVRIPVLRLLVLMAVLHLALQHTRHQMVAGIIGALVVAEPLGRELQLLPATRRGQGKLASLAAGGFFLTVASAATLLRIANPLLPSEIPNTPLAALEHVPPRLAAKPVLNDYSFGAYLIFSGVRPFIDSRAELYGDSFLKQYAKMTSGDQAQLSRVLRTRNIGWALLRPKSRLAVRMDSLEGWRSLYSDQRAVVFVRSGEDTERP